MTKLTIIEEYTHTTKPDRTPLDENQLIYIYGLICPDTDEIFYVGKTVEPQRRLEVHVSQHDHYERWYRSDTPATLKMVILEKCPRYQSHPSNETYWMLKVLSEGIQLENRVFPSRLPSNWVFWLDTICDLYGWVNLKSVNDRVRELPDYGSRS